MSILKMYSFWEENDLSGITQHQHVAQLRSEARASFSSKHYGHFTGCSSLCLLMPSPQLPPASCVCQLPGRGCRRSISSGSSITYTRLCALLPCTHMPPPWRSLCLDQARPWRQVQAEGLLGMLSPTLSLASPRPLQPSGPPT